MKKIIKYTLLILFIIIICALVVFRHKISLVYNLGMKYMEVKDNPSSMTLNLNALENMDYKDVVYKERNGKKMTLDIYSGKNPSKKLSPVILYVHGGSWIYGDKSIPTSISPILEAFREEGFTIISTSYELLNKSISFEEQVSDVKDTLKWINKHGEDYGVDKNEIGVIGTSSGAHLSLLSIYSEKDDFRGSKELLSYEVKVDYIIDLFGPTDLSTLDKTQATWDMEQVLNSIPNKDEQVKKYSPINYVKEGLPNILIVHSKGDDIVPYKNAEELYNKNTEKGNDATLLTLNLSEHDMSDISEEDIKSFVFGMLKFILINTPN